MTPWLWGVGRGRCLQNRKAYKTRKVRLRLFFADLIDFSWERIKTASHVCLPFNVM